MVSKQVSSYEYRGRNSNLKNMKTINKIELNISDYMQTIYLPSNSIILDIIRTKVFGICEYHLLYEYDGYSKNPTQLENSLYLNTL